MVSPQGGRDCPDSLRLRRAFRCTVKRRQRRSDGTVSLAGRRFEIPDRYRHLKQPLLHYARWDLSAVELLDPNTREPLCALYGLKWNPFSPQLPTEALYRTAKIDNFCWRIEQALVHEGGFALISGDPGTGKSVVLRLLASAAQQETLNCTPIFARSCCGSTPGRCDATRCAQGKKSAFP